MNSLALNRYKTIHLCLILSILTSFFVMPTTAKAGVLSKVWSALRPVTYIAGRIGGAVAGATMGSAILPPLGMIVGGVAGWIVGGMLTDYASASLSNLAAVGVGIAGALAMGPSAVGIVGGFLVGGLVGKLAMNLLTKADRRVTGGVLLSKAQSVQIGSNNEISVSASREAAAAPAETFSGAASTNEDVKVAQDLYQKAYQKYTDSVKKCANSKVVKEAQELYKSAYDKYRRLINK